MSGQQPLKLTKRLNSNVEVGKFTALVISTGTYTDGCDVPAGANVGPVAGIADESILPEGFADYISGQYQIVSGTAWPANALPASSTGKAIAVVRIGVTRAIAASAVNPGDRVNIADSNGRLKTINEVAGTLVYEVGEAKTAAGQANDVFQIIVNPIVRKA